MPIAVHPPLAPEALRPRGAALVTGGGRRIGAAIVRALAQAGYDVAIHCNAATREAQALAAEIAGAGRRAAVVPGDLGDPDVCAGLVARATASVGSLSVLVNNASIFEDDRIGALDRALWERQMAINLRAPVFLTESFAGHLPAAGHGCVVNVIDQRVLKPTPQFVSYTLSKSALLTATRTLAQALAPRVRVCGVGPGPTLANPRQSTADFARQSGAVPLGRGPRPDAIADAVVYLVGAESVTGVMLPVDGGQHLAWATPDVDDGAGRGEEG